MRISDLLKLSADNLKRRKGRTVRRDEGPMSFGDTLKTVFVLELLGQRIVSDGSEEWTVLDKVIGAALASAPVFALAAPGEKLALHARRFMQESFCWRLERDG